MNKKIIIGGEFAANSFYNSFNILSNITIGQTTNSGRAALELLLNEKTLNKIDQIYLPFFMCPSIMPIIKKYFKKYFFYDLDKDFLPIVPKIKKNSAFLKINYFGKTNNIKLKNTIIIEDRSHNIDIPKKNTNSFYFGSLRKSGIFNIGGWCSVGVSTKTKHKNHSKFLAKFRKKKFFYLKEKNLSLKKEKKLINEFKKIENIIYKEPTSLSINKIKKITNLSINKIKKIRKNNYNFLIKNINSKDILDLNLKKNETPLFFILKLKNSYQRNKLKVLLKKNNIFCPIHWILNNKKKNFQNTNSNEFSKTLLSIPIDHRYNLKHMKIILNVIKFFLKNL